MGELTKKKGLFEAVREKDRQFTERDNSLRVYLAQHQRTYEERKGKREREQMFEDQKRALAANGYGKEHPLYKKMDEDCERVETFFVDYDSWARGSKDTWEELKQEWLMEGHTNFAQCRGPWSDDRYAQYNEMCKRSRPGEP